MFKGTLIVVLVLLCCSVFAGGAIIPTGEGQTSNQQAYRFAVDRAENYWVRRGNFDMDFTAGDFGELPIFWAVTGSHRGSFIYPDTLSSPRPFDFANNPGLDLSTIDKMLSVNIPSKTGVAIFRASVRDDMRQSTSWQFSYFRTFVDDYLGWNSSRDVRFYWDSTLTNVHNDVKVIIIPAFEYSTPPTAYMDEVVALYGSHLSDALASFLSRGGMIYAEGNAGYLVEALGLLPEGTVTFDSYIDGVGPGSFAGVTAEDSDHPLSFFAEPIYTVAAPTLSEDGNVILRYTEAFDPADVGKPACVEYHHFGGRILLMASLPTAKVFDTSDQWQFTANAVLSAFANEMSLSRSIFTEFITDSVDIAPMSLPVGISTEAEIKIVIRNLWNEPIADAVLVETLNRIFEYNTSVAGPSPVVNDNILTFTLPVIPANSSMTIRYTVKTPEEEDARWYNIDRYLSWEDYALVSSSRLSYASHSGDYVSEEYRRSLFGKFLFEADIVADTDLNWKNILGEFYQPFKIFMIMENKERTSAYQTKYVQYIPIDVPIYWVDPMAIPIIRTPGAEFVDLLRGSYDEGTVLYDIDGDGNPDAWLDISSFTREPDSLVEELIYWKNPWSGEYEDFNRNGIHPRDTDGDGVVDFHDEGDRIRAYRAVWLIDEVPGYDFYDPYVSWELWIDPPPLVDMAIGASIHEDMGYLGDPSDGYYYEDWYHWMEKDEYGEVVVKRLIRKTMHSYEGYIFADSAYTLLPGDTDYGYVPRPRQEYIAVLNLGGREPTMRSPIPPEEDTLYGKVTYKTLWGTHKTFPIRTTYTYYVPLPNPLQFEYITCAFEIKDPSTGALLDFLPAYNEADITFHLTASTEYSYYWIRNVGQDFGTFNWHGREWVQESTERDGFGDGVFGYMIHEIPKGMGGYSIELQRDPVTGDFDIDAIVPDYQPFLFDHDSVATEVEIIEYPFYYAVYIPQILMPPALDDNNFDGVDDWIDDIGDRFRSPTGCLYDEWPPFACDSAEAIYAVSPWDITTPIEGDLAWPHEGWYWGEDETYGDDLVEKLGMYRTTVNARFVGGGREGLLPINRGVWLVNEEIFGGSPWVQFSHSQSVLSKGSNLIVQRSPNPHLVSLYPDSVLMRWRIFDPDEPHSFDVNFDPWINAQSDGEIVIVTRIGGKEPSGLFEPEFVGHSRIDPIFEARTITAIPNAHENPELVAAGYPKTQHGALLTIVIEVNNNSNNDWYNVTIGPEIGHLGATTPFLWYASYPRPLVPAHVDPATGEVIYEGDDPTVFRAGWRFNSSALEVLNKIGNPDGTATIPELKASRRAYYIFHLTVDPTLENGIYDLPFSFSGRSHHYTDPPPGGGAPLDYEIQSAMFAIVDKVEGGYTISDPELVIGEISLESFETVLEDYVEIPEPTSAFRWFESGWPPFANYDTRGEPITGSVTGSILSLNLPYSTFPPSPDRTEFFLGAMSVVDAPFGSDRLPLDEGAQLSYTDVTGQRRTASSHPLFVEARGSQLTLMKMVSQVNDEDVIDNNFVLSEGENLVTISLRCSNLGNDIARNLTLYAVLGTHAQFSATDPRFDFTQRGDTMIWNNPFDVYPGSARDVDVELLVSRDDSYDRVDIMYAFITDFQDEDSESAPLYREFDLDTITYACDFILTDDMLSIDRARGDLQIGDVVNITAEVHYEGNMTVKDVMVRLYENEEALEEATILEFSPTDTIALVTFPFTISNMYHRLFVKVDPDGLIKEADENNNTGQMEITVGTGKPLQDILAFPSPFKDYTEFTFVVTRELDKIELKVFTVRGRLVRDFGVIEYNPRVGYNHHPWDGRDDKGDQIGNGTYIYKLYAQDTEGKVYEFVERIVRMR